MSKEELNKFIVEIKSVREQIDTYRKTELPKWYELLTQLNQTDE